MGSRESFDSCEAREKIAVSLDYLNARTEDIGIETRLVGSLGLYGLTGIEPRLYRGTDSEGRFEVVDVDYLIGLTENADLFEVKRICDEIWNRGAGGDYRVEMSPINLPKEVANNPDQVINFWWRLGERMEYRDKKGNRRVIFPEGFTEGVEVDVYGVKMKTLTPTNFLALKLTDGWWAKNPKKVVRDVECWVGLRRTFPEIDLVVRNYIGNIVSRNVF